MASRSPREPGRAADGRQYYRDCYISGYVGFIFGNATAASENSGIHSRGGGGHITAQSRNTPDGVYLGRPWRVRRARPLAANRWDELGQQKSAAYFADLQRTTKAGARPLARHRRGDRGDR